jgi:hypothetical protein
MTQAQTYLKQYKTKLVTAFQDSPDAFFENLHLSKIFVCWYKLMANPAVVPKIRNTKATSNSTTHQISSFGYETY